MTNNKYIIKSLAPWMIDELIAFSEFTNFELIFLRTQDEFYNDGIKQLKEKGVNISVKPFSLGNLIKKIFIVFKFLISNISNFKLDYNFIIGFKSIVWFLRLDMSKFSANSTIHAQFATQAALVSYLIKKYFNDEIDYSITFHAYDIYFNNKWLKLLVNNCNKAFSISNYNIDYVQKKFLVSNKIILSRLGVFRSQLQVNRITKEENSILTLGLISWFVEKKGIIYLLETMKMLKEDGFNKIKLVLAGDGPLKNDFLEFIRKNELSDNINYLGKIKGEDKHIFFKDIDAFVLPSIELDNDKDGIPVVLMEATAASLPIISTNVSGIPEICIDKYNGRLINEKSTKDLYEAILELYKNPEYRSTYSQKSYDLSREYDILLNSKAKLQKLNWI